MLGQLIATQNGVVARWQVLALGMTDAQVHYKLRSGAWRALYPGVYATFTGPTTREVDLWAAVLLCSKEQTRTRTPGGGVLLEPDAALSHQTAADLHGVRDDPSSLIHVTVSNRRRKPRAAEGVVVHMSAHLDRARHPALLPPRTRLIDTVIELTQTARTTDDAVNWLSRACGNRLTTPARLAEALEARKKLRRRLELMQALGFVSQGSHTVIEQLYHRNVELAHGLPRGQRQVRRVTGSRSEYDDVKYPEYKTVVELDGRIGHEYEGVFRDRRRDNAAVARGEIPLRYGFIDVDEYPCDTAGQVVLVLKANGWPDDPVRCSPICTLINGVYQSHMTSKRR